MSKAFENVRVIDFSQVLAGPYATAQLALLGADVIKIEQPGNGDMMRRLTTDGEWAGRGLAPAFLGANQGKRAITLDLKHERAREIVGRLAESADVVVENFRPGVMKRLGFDYETIREIRPDIVYCSVSGYGQEGPKAGLPAYDGAVQASSGIMSVTGHPESGPVRVGFMVVDMSTALHAAFAIASALYRRQVTGEGQYLDVAMNDTAIQMMNPLVSRYLVDGEVPGLVGNRTQAKQGTADTWPTRDGHIAIAVITDRMVQGLCRALERPDWAETERFGSVEGRIAHADAINGEIAEVLAGGTTDTWLERLGAEGVPASPVHDVPTTLADPQLDHRDVLMRFEVPDSAAGEITLPGVGFTASPGAPAAERLAPTLGQHTDEVLAELGYDAAEIQVLRDGGVI
ncbi:MAG: CoA transferase [Alphaproteobacteria bacterium]|nr:CoA transferase [Alphaproteobacteria bacterium]